MPTTLTPVRFHFYSLKFTPYKEDSSKVNSSIILHKILTYLSNQINEGQGHLIDRNQGRPQEESRELFLTHAVFMPKERRIRCSIALLRAGRTPMLKPLDKFKLIPLDHMGTIAEQTHFFIDFSKNVGVICLEYNYHGPRISDIEYYFRNVGRDTLKIAKATEIEMFMDTSIDDTLANLKNVLNMEIKIQPKNFAQMDTRLVGSYFSGMNNIGNLLKPNFIKIETLFQTPGKSVTSSQLNTPANKMVLDLLRTFKGRPFNIDVFDNFVVKYESKDGKEEIFNLLKGKKEVIKEVDLSTILKARHWYELIEKEFDEFMEELSK